MGKFIKSADLEAALSKADTEEKNKAVTSQVIETVKAYEAAEAKTQNKIDVLHSDLDVIINKLNKAYADLAIANEELAASNEIVAELSAKLNKAEENRGNPNLQVTVGKKDYQIIGNKFQTVNGEYSAEDLAKDETLLKEMIAKGSGAILPL
jgi:hypothetical protein